MPKKTKFIDKANSTHYHLLHRSQTDGAYAEEGVPSEFVLVSANEVSASITCIYNYRQDATGPVYTDGLPLSFTLN